MLSTIEEQQIRALLASANKRISELTAVVTPSGTDEFAVNQGGVSKKETLDQIKTYVEGSINDKGLDQVEVIASRNLSETDLGKVLYNDNTSSTFVITLPPENDVTLPANAFFYVYQKNNGILEVTAQANTTINGEPASTVNTQGIKQLFLLIRSNNAWEFFPLNSALPVVEIPSPSGTVSNKNRNALNVPGTPAQSYVFNVSPTVNMVQGESFHVLQTQAVDSHSVTINAVGGVKLNGIIDDAYTLKELGELVKVTSMGNDEYFLSFSYLRLDHINTLNTGTTVFNNTNQMDSIYKSQSGAATIAEISASAVLPLGSRFTVIRDSSETVTISGDTSVVINGVSEGSLEITELNGRATAVKIAEPYTWNVTQSQGSSTSVDLKEAYDNGNDINFTDGDSVDFISFEQSLTLHPVNFGGTDYVVNDLIGVTGGTSYIDAVLRVVSIGGGGAITNVAVVDTGVYTEAPTPLIANPVTGGTGSGATLDLTMGEAGRVLHYPGSLLPINMNTPHGGLGLPSVKSDHESALELIERAAWYNPTIKQANYSDGTKIKRIASDMKEAYDGGSTVDMSASPAGAVVYNSKENSVEDFTVNTGGINYIVGDVLSAAGGTATTPNASIRVESVGGSGEILTHTKIFSGIYTADPTPLSSNPLAGGAGTGATANIAMKKTGTASIDPANTACLDLRSCEHSALGLPQVPDTQEAGIIVQEALLWQDPKSKALKYSNGSIAKKVSEFLYIQDSNSTPVPGIITVENTAAKTSIKTTGAGSFLFNKNQLKQYDSFRVVIAGEIRTNGPDQTINFKLDDSNTWFLLNAIPTLANLGALTAFKLTAHITVQRIGTSGRIKTIVDFGRNLSSTTLTSLTMSTHTVNTELGLTFNPSVEWGLAHVSNKINVHTLDFYRN